MKCNNRFILFNDIYMMFIHILPPLLDFKCYNWIAAMSDILLCINLISNYFYFLDRIWQLAALSSTNYYVKCFMRTNIHWGLECFVIIFKKILFEDEASQLARSSEMSHDGRGIYAKLKFECLNVMERLSDGQVFKWSAGTWRTRYYILLYQ